MCGLSRSHPQPVWKERQHPRSGGCGIVATGSPQTVDDRDAHIPRVSLSTGNPQPGAGCPQLLHTAVHCSATKRQRPPGRVKGITPRRPVGLWGRWVKLGTTLGRTGRCLCIACAELFGVHRTPWLSTASTHRPGGQKTAADQGRVSFPRFPQALLLRPQRDSGEFASKWGLCTTSGRAARHLAHRLDPEPHRLSAAYVRLVSGYSADDEGQQGEPATAGGGLR